MSDFESTGAVSGGSGSSSAAPSTGASGYGSDQPVAGAGGEGYDERGTAGTADTGDDGSFDSDDGIEEDPTEARIAAAERRAQEWEERFKGIQGPRQQAEERARQAEARASMLETQYRHAQQQQAAQQQRQQFYAALEGAKAQLYHAQQVGDHAAAQRIQYAISSAVAEQQRLDAHAEREAQLARREAHLQKMQADMAPVKKQQTVEGYRAYYQKEFGVNVPVTVVKAAMEHAQTPREAAAMIWGYAFGGQGKRDAQRTETLEQEAQQQTRVGPARGGQSSASIQKQLRELELSGDLGAVLAFRSKHRLNKTQRVRV